MKERLRQYLMTPLQEWLRNNKNGMGLLVKAGIPGRTLRAFKGGSISSRFFFKHTEAIEKVTGLSVEMICLGAAKRYLWGVNDRFPHITSRAKLAEELQRLTTNRLGEVESILHVNGPAQLQRIVDNPTKLHIDRVVSVFDALSHLQPGTLTAENASLGMVSISRPQPQLAKEKPTVNLRGNHSEQITNALTSIFSSLANIAEADLDPKAIPPIAKLNLASAVMKVFQKMGVTAEVIREFRQRRAITADGAETLRQVFDALSINPTTKGGK